MQTMVEKLYYMAHPYSAKTPEGEARNFDLANERASKLLEAGYYIYSPISMTHHMHLVRPQPYEKWMELDKVIVDRCDGIILTPGWENSNGCKKEKAWFEEQEKEVLYYVDIIEEY